MKDEAAAHFEKARQALHTAHLALTAGDANGCVNRAYYAAYHVASAALITAGETTKTHKGTHNRFWVRFVESGSIPPDIGQVLPQAQQMRRQADYEAFTRFDTMAASDLLTDVEGFVQAVEALMQDLDDDAD